MRIALHRFVNKVRINTKIPGLIDTMQSRLPTLRYHSFIYTGSLATINTPVAGTR